jgi:hypothetical protein
MLLHCFSIIVMLWFNRHDEFLEQSYQPEGCMQPSDEFYVACLYIFLIPCHLYGKKTGTWYKKRFFVIVVGIWQFLSLWTTVQCIKECQIMM